MNKYVVVSSNNNPDYFFYAPYQRKAWNKYGWKLVVMCTHDVEAYIDCDMLIQLPKFEGVRDQTVAQASRLYAANYLPEDALIMTCDMDLLPLSDYWHPDPNDITVYGHDLTWHSYFPMGYVAMSAKNWKEKFNLTGNTEANMVRDFAKYWDMVNSENWETWWNYDWRYLTDTLMPFKSQLKFIDRGQVDIAGATLAKGRIDRYNIAATSAQSVEFIDFHGHNTSMNNPERNAEFVGIYERFHGKI